ncbi:hypothetical protein FJZ31_40365 [Candidatus Poribacteria bacterium]|nr:hypothetical protein [Candidatus Poribacteria bacterium]
MTASEIRYLIDEDTTHRIRKGLLRRQPSIDIKVIGEEGAPPLGNKDADILDYLEKAGYILISTNRSTMPKHLQEHLLFSSYFF